MTRRIQNIARELRELIREVDDARYRLRREKSQVESRVRQKNTLVSSYELQKKCVQEVENVTKKLWGKKMTPEQAENRLEIILAEVERLERDLQ